MFLNSLDGELLFERRMIHSEHQSVHFQIFVIRIEFQAVLMPHFIRVGMRVADMYVHAIFLQLADQIDHTRVADIADVFFEGDTHDHDSSTLHSFAAFDQLLDRLLSDVLAHIVVDAATGEDDLRMIAQLLGLVKSNGLPEFHS